MVPCADVALKRRWAVSMPRNKDQTFFFRQTQWSTCVTVFDGGAPCVNLSSQFIVLALREKKRANP